MGQIYSLMADIQFVKNDFRYLMHSALEGIRTPNLLIRSRRPPVSLCFRWSLILRFYAQFPGIDACKRHWIPQYFFEALANC